ncbi:MAG TPA: hypothetical protein VFA83_05070 [Acidimicrobiales bacterium]|nr:hypothetical protein [Acidimicrobiales bacterium]
MSREFFDEVDMAVRGFLPPALREFSARRTSANLKVWFEEDREHYEVQLIRGGALEIGFHAEHRAVEQNEELLERLVAQEKAWRKALGPEPEAGAFLGRQSPWRRVSEVWDHVDDDASIEAAERLADYIQALEPVRTGKKQPAVRERKAVRRSSR